MHLMRTQLAELVSPETLVGFEKGNELVPDLCVSWEEAIDARHTRARPPELDASGMLDSLAIVTEFKATASTMKPTPPRDIRRDLRKLGLFAEAATKGTNPLATYMVILDNHRRDDGTASSRYRPDRMSRLLGRVAEKWPESAPKPVVLVGGEDGMDRHPNLTASSG